MFKKSMMFVVTGLIAAPLLAVPVEAKYCKSKTIWARGDTKITCLSACASAKTAWRKKVRARYGAKYDSYNLAKNARVVCVEDKGIKEWCSASGKPCKP